MLPEDNHPKSPTVPPEQPSEDEGNPPHPTQLPMAAYSSLPLESTETVTQTESQYESYYDYNTNEQVMIKPAVGGWTDDDIASISLSGCLSVLMLTVAWTAIFFGNALSTEIGDTSSRTVQQTDNTYLIGVLLISFIGFLGSAYFFGIRNHPRKWQSVGFKAVSSKWIIMAVLIGIFYMPINIGVTLIIDKVIGFSAMSATQTEDSSNSNTFTEEFDTANTTVIEIILLFGLAAFLIPIAEEVFFRGILYRWLRVRGGFWIGLGISSIIFGSLHVGPQAVSISVIGAIMALSYEGSKSLWIPITIHATNNALALILTFTGILTELSV